MKKMIAFVSFLAAALCLSGCRTSSPSEYANYPVRVIDGDTRQPVTGALVSSVSTGGSQFTTNVYYTDMRGAATVMYYANSRFVVVRVQKEGYETNFAAVSPAKSVVSLKKFK
jgi:hypothetical protein